MADSFNATARFFEDFVLFSISFSRVSKMTVYKYNAKVEKIWYLCLLSDVLHAWQKQPDDGNCSEKMVLLSTEPEKDMK